MCYLRPISVCLRPDLQVCPAPQRSPHREVPVEGHTHVLCSRRQLPSQMKGPPGASPGTGGRTQEVCGGGSLALWQACACMDDCFSVALTTVTVCGQGEGMGRGGEEQGLVPQTSMKCTQRTARHCPTHTPAHPAVALGHTWLRLLGLQPALGQPALHLPHPTVRSKGARLSKPQLPPLESTVMPAGFS